MTSPKRGVYIAGKMRGERQFGFPAFFAAEEWLRANGWGDPIFNPARRDESLGFKAREWNLSGHEDLTKPIPHPVRFDGMQYVGAVNLYHFDLAAAMEADNDFIRSDECTTVVFIPGWGASEGARDELKLAQECGKEVLYFRGCLQGFDKWTWLWDAPYPSDVADARDAEWAEQSEAIDTASRIVGPGVTVTGVTGEQRLTSPTGGQKGQKPERHSLIPGHALDEVARVYAFGAEKYDDHNWRKGYAWSLSMDAMLRHANALKKGEWLDAESGLPHMAHAAFHCLSLLEWAAIGQIEQNDIYGLEVE